jgi:ATP-dependent Zn protease
VPTSTALSLVGLMRRVVAVHEAGHAVIARVLNIPSGIATIDPERPFASYAGPLNAAIARARSGRKRRATQSWDAVTIVHLSGQAAEVELLGQEHYGDYGDRQQVARLLWEADHTHRWPRLQQAARQLVRRHQSAIHRVADALLLRTTLTGPEIDCLVGQK